MRTTTASQSHGTPASRQMESPGAAPKVLGGPDERRARPPRRPGARPAPRYSAYPRLRDATVRLLGRGWVRGLSRSTYRGHADNPSIKIVDRATPAHTPPSHPCQSCPGPPPPPCSRKERGNLALRTKARGLIALIEAHREKGTLPSLLALL
ncbi:hypothetical protein Purlil1_2285 [Purpureocillium lilacinum]|uniref:Uncharacterized protein n=1 Tax=Purpureocillium lilacinum TaxID=33203 RepID=A0ABR0CB00_PURLI|nr:hypothetical protein Purlil1_2285 [Purpureocillium lilacinum]